MTHPFFDGAAYPWHRSEGRAFHKLLYQRFDKQADIELVYKQVSADLPPLPTGAPAHVWQEALDRCAKLGLLRTLHQQLLDNGDFGRHERSLAVLEAVRQSRAAVDLAVLPGVPGLVMLDRAQLRRYIRRLAPAGNPLKVLVVRGEPQSGKSHGRHLFESAARDAGAKSVYLCDGLVATVDDVLVELFGAYSATAEIPPAESTEHGWYKAACGKLRAIAERNGCALWIAVDDLGVAEDGAPLLDPQIRAFFEQFALHLVSGVYKDWFRLMLIDYPEGAVPSRWHRDLWAEDRTARADITVEHVVELLTTWSAQRGRTAVEESVADVAAGILGTVDGPDGARAGDAGRLPHLHDLLVASLEADGEHGWT
ncbi:hypothetical protein Daura_17110 [Dactylosporangium aurantiacum]|uniref:Uncharacterized protein n=1 Tax=Dactylosporangium aurantiacum TaxID=35754 RepID=A0A9Q9MIB2_9ACTN|nr:hypothetical protein [Dactylosporangium aurantiacum]MDG6103226.1 hypothetical protein [Dactylosporangium aurantiacum]UWZ57729.1 hypothetical protein Daura_17110 [Dactylosporangium aurantiacum]